MSVAYGVQVYSVRDELQKDYVGCLKKCSEIGYKAVELCGFGGYSASKLSSICKDLGLRISGNHDSANALRPENIENTIAYYTELGRPNFIVPGIDLSTREKLDDFIELLNWAQPKMENAGIVLGYHNHSHEFLPTSYGAIIHDELRDRTRVNFEIDTYWAYNAGRNPLDMMMVLKDRVPVIHLKDGLMGGHGKALGEGTAPVRGVRNLAISLGMEIIVESETLDPTGPEEITRCYKYLQKLDNED